MWYFGLLPAAMFVIGMVISFRQAFNQNIEQSHKAEVCGVLWLIAALICFK